MKRIKLLGLLSLFVVPVLGNTISLKQNNSVVRAGNVLNSPSKKELQIPKEGEDAIENVNTGVKYAQENIQTAIDEANDGDRLILLKDLVAPGAKEARTTTDDLKVRLKFNSAKTIYLSGGVDEDSQDQYYTFDGYGFDISNVGAHLELDHINILGEKETNSDNNDAHCLFRIEKGGELVLNKGTDISDFKSHTAGVMTIYNIEKVSPWSTVTINEGVKIHDCAAMQGAFYLYCQSKLIMNGGEICYNRSTNKSTDNYHEGIAVYANASEFYMYGGSIHDNDAHRWDQEEDPEINSYGTIYLSHDQWSARNPSRFYMYGGEIKNNVVKRGGVAYCNLASGGLSPEIYIGGKIYAYDNIGTEVQEIQPLNQSNFYLKSNEIIKVDEQRPLHSESKIGLFTGKTLEKGEESPTVVSGTRPVDLASFVSDDVDYTVKRHDDGTICIYHYKDTDARFSVPRFNDGLYYNGQEQNLIREPGKVIKGGEMRYSLDYQENNENATWTNDYTQIKGKTAGDYEVAYYVTAKDDIVQSDVQVTVVTIGKQLMNIVWPEDNFIYKGFDRKDELKPYYVKEGENIYLDIEELKLEDGSTPEGGFLKPTEDPNNRYVVTAVKPDGEDDFTFPEDHSKLYTMRISGEQYIEEGKIEIEVDEKTNKPTIEVESDIGYDAWTTLNGKKLDKKKHEKEYKAAVNELSKTKKINDNVSLSGVYDVTMLSHTYEGGEEVVTVVRELDGNLKISLLLPKGVKGSSFKVYQIHENEDGSKEVITLKHTFEKDGYVTIVTNKLSAFAIIKSKKSLLWLIILLSVINALLIGALVYIFFKIKKSKENRNDLGASV